MGADRGDARPDGDLVTTDRAAALLEDVFGEPPMLAGAMTRPRARPPTRARFGRAIATWHVTTRRDLPVRHATRPWPILVAEVMSQQTQIERVGPAWKRFVGLWPEPRGLAAAETRDVLRAWAGLGYNRRALALREAARTIVREHGGQVPDTVPELELLPGVGPYTARAVAASAFGVPVAPLDVNVRRVVGRVVGEAVPPGRLQDAADGLVSRDDPRAWVDAVMDLAATVCTTRAPRCATCPLAGMCRSAGSIGSAARAPATPTTPATPFSRTNRWLRGRLLAAVRDAPPGSWVDAPDGLGEHDRDAVTAALHGLKRDGFVEFRDGRARLAADRP
jgi:A/G-specific adenine glycosylase